MVETWLSTQSSSSRYVKFAHLIGFVFITITLQESLAFHVTFPNQNFNHEPTDLSVDSPPDRVVHRIDRYSPSANWKLLWSKKSVQGNYQLDPNGKIHTFTRNLLRSIEERTSYANSEEEILEVDNEPAGDVGINLMRKRSEQVEYHTGGCEAKRMWIPLGSDHFPRYIKSYNCTSENCDRSFGECRRKSYSVKVLRMNSPENTSVMDEGCDQHLPEELRCDWKLVPIEVTIYCECFSVSLSSSYNGK